MMLLFAVHVLLTMSIQRETNAKAIQCGYFEWYDKVLNNCLSCRNLCFRKEAENQCQRVCPEYYRDYRKTISCGYLEVDDTVMDNCHSCTCCRNLCMQSKAETLCQQMCLAYCSYCSYNITLAADSGKENVPTASDEEEPETDQHYA